jgi:hypothetical protein
LFTGRSSGGYLVFFFGMLVSWSSGKTKPTQSTSVGEAEMWFAYLLAKELIYLMDMTGEMQVFPASMFKSAWQCIDSKSTIEGMRLVGATNRNKHWDIRIFYMRGMNNAEERIRFIWVDTTKQLADIMTKSQPPKIGMINRECIRGTLEDQKYFAGVPTAVSLKKIEDFIFVSNDNGRNWFMPSHFADCVDSDVDRMTWMSDGSSERIDNRAIQVRKVNFCPRNKK